MIDPKRWLDEGGGGTFEERELLQAGRDLRIPDTLRKRVWVGVATGLTAIETVAAAGTALQKGVAAKGAFAMLSSTTAKGVTAIAIASGVGLGVASLRSPSATPPVTPPAPTQVARDEPSLTTKSPASLQRSPETAFGSELGANRAAESPVPPETAAAPTTDGIKPRTLHAARPSARPAAPPAPRASVSDVQSAEPSQETRRASRLAEESAAVVAIRKTLLSGDPSEALRMIDRSRTQFPDGALGQEREALTVRALVESGQKAAAKKRGEAFLRAFPRSPHAAELRALLGP